jgi:hypothetical protein
MKVFLANLDFYSNTNDTICDNANPSPIMSLVSGEKSNFQYVREPLYPL